MFSCKRYQLFILVGVFGVSYTLSAKEFLIKWNSFRAFDRQIVGKKMYSSTVSMPVLSKNNRAMLTKVEVADSLVSVFLVWAKSKKEIDYVSENLKVHASTLSTSNKSLIFQKDKLRSQWALEKIKALKAWSLLGKQKLHPVVLAVIDTGADSNHESLEKNMIAGYDFKNNDSDPQDETGFLNPGHGTHCSGIAGATGEISNGTSGINPYVQLMPLRFLDSKSSGTIENAVRAIDYALEKGVHVISASWGAELTAKEAMPLIEAIKRASDAGVIFVTSAGNGDENGVGYSTDTKEVYPANARFENTITVAASDESDEAPRFSNFGKNNVDIAAPGVNILSTLPHNRYDELSGTSMSAPLVAGLVALIKSIRFELTGSQIKKILQDTGARVDIETACNCRIDAAAAVQKVLELSTLATFLSENKK